MPRTKKAVAAAEAEVKEVKTAAAEAEVAGTPAKKTRAKKTTAAKKTAVKAEEKAPEVVEAVVEAKEPETKAVEAPKAEVFIEFGGVQVAVDEIVKNAKLTVKNAKLTVGEDKDIKVYVKPDESKAYIVAGEETVAMDVFFCE